MSDEEFDKILEELKLNLAYFNTVLNHIEDEAIKLQEKYNA